MMKIRSPIVILALLASAFAESHAHPHPQAAGSKVGDQKKFLLGKGE